MDWEVYQAGKVGDPGDPDKLGNSLACELISSFLPRRYQGCDVTGTNTTAKQGNSRGEDTESSDCLVPPVSACAVSPIKPQSWCACHLPLALHLPGVKSASS